MAEVLAGAATNGGHGPGCSLGERDSEAVHRCLDALETVVARGDSGGLASADQHSVGGTGALNIGATRARDELAPASTKQVLSRWPANLGLIHDIGCRTGKRCRGECAVRQIDTRVGHDVSRFFYAAKANRNEREAGLADLEPVDAPFFSGSPRTPRANVHPTVKPISVMRWLVRLVTPPLGVVLDPFAGSGSTGCAALLEDRQFIGIERETSYVEIARRRLSHWARQDEGPA